ncbi:MAG TPA: hypothetical protein VEQ35_04475 [Beijerinckia sp.]|jgi:hypothetical protein|nr:hypothetical protein [Beijerinckia sp.]
MSSSKDEADKGEASRAKGPAETSQDAVKAAQKQRLAAALRENLSRRKAQIRERRQKDTLSDQGRDADRK